MEALTRAVLGKAFSGKLVTLGTEEEDIPKNNQ
jgi:hypothetical protein